MNRLDNINEWLKSHIDRNFSLEPASFDASFRRYFRVFEKDTSYILMDAPPGKEDIQPFLNVAQKMLDAKVNVPKIMAFNLALGTVLMQDFGSSTYLDVLDKNNASGLYGDATLALASLQKNINIHGIQQYDKKKLTEEMSLFIDWYLIKYKNLSLNKEDSTQIENSFRIIAEKVNSQPQVFVHRDYHSRNLMVLSDKKNNPGILDFQDALIGPITYDLVSLMKDAYIEWEEEFIIDQAVRYWEKAKKLDLKIQQDFSEFYEDFEWAGVQRHLKVLGIFARLSIRDHKDQYLKDIPLVEKYLWNTVIRYKELFPLRNFLEGVIHN